MTRKDAERIKTLNNQIASCFKLQANCDPDKQTFAALQKRINKKLVEIETIKKRPALPDFCPAAANGTKIKEIHYNPTRYRYDEDGESIEPCEKRQADQHSVYLRDTDGLLHNIADFATFKQADLFQKLIENIVQTIDTLPPKDNGFNNSDFEWKMQHDFSRYSNLSYSLEKDELHNTWNLSINSTSSSELDGSDKGTLEDYSYNEAREAIEDIQTAEARHGTRFDEI